MANWSDPRVAPAAAPTETGARGSAVDAGLRSHMLSVYNYMTSGVLLTGVVALLFARSGMAAQVFVNGGILKWIVMLAPLGLVMWLSFGINRLSETAAKLLFFVYAATVGLSISVIFLLYTGSSIATVFFATSAAFASLSLWGYTTKKDLSGWGSFLLMGVVGIIVASVLNMFIGSSAMSMGIAALGVLIFAGLTAYDTQKIKSFYFELRGTEFLGKAAIMGALELYLDFINMFLYLLRLFGSRD